MEEQEITTLSEYNEMEATLRSLAEQATAITVPDKDMQKTLQKTRTRIEKIGKFLREDFVRQGKQVIAKEKELIAIIEPQEQRLKLLQEQADMAIERTYREGQFEARKARFDAIGVELQPDVSVEMNDTEFEAYYSSELMGKQEQKARELEAREAKLREAEEAQKREAEAKEREERAIAEEKARGEREREYLIAKALKAEEDAREKIRKEQELAEQKAQADKAKLEKDIMYQTWLESHGWDGGVLFKLERSGTQVKLYKLVDTMEI